jgi:hypothetical protein
MDSEKSKTFHTASQGKHLTLGRELWEMVWQNKKFWMIPILIVLLLFGLLLFLSTTPAAPFIYTLF